MLQKESYIAQEAFVKRSSAACQRLGLRVGELVEVKCKEEILRTLDGDGRVDALPFMPEMLEFCGKQFRVYRRAIKLCDTITKTGMRRMENTVLLDNVRCDGSAHGSCQAGCLILWKEAWLKRASDGSPNGDSVGEWRGDRVKLTGETAERPGCVEADLYRAACLDAPQQSLESQTFRCQVTELKQATLPLSPWDVVPYAQEVLSGNRGFWEWLRGMLIMLFNWVQSVRGGCPYPCIPQGRLKKTPQGMLNLKPGELVMVKTEEEILQTLDTNYKNRGLWFDVEMLKYCGRTFRVKGRVERLINERTGKMVEFTNDCIILDRVTCHGDCHQFCNRSEYIFWREIWLKRVG